MDTVLKLKLILFVTIFSIITICYPKSEHNMASFAIREKPIKIKNLANKMIILQPRLKKDTAEVYEFLINKYCDSDTYNIIIAILYGESSLNYSSISSGGDYGLGQIRYSTWGKYFNLTKEKLLNPIVNIKYSCKILQLTKKAHPNDSTYWSFYHHRKKNLRDKYVKKINSILQKIEDK